MRSNLRAIVILTAAVVTLVAANLYVRRGDGSHLQTHQSTLVHPDVVVTRVRIERKGSPILTLVKTTDWKLATPYIANVDRQVVLKMLDALTLTPVSDMIAESELLKLGRTPADFKLVDPVLKVTVCGNEGETEISFGEPLPTADGVYASIAGLSSVYVVPASVFNEVDRQVDSLRLRSMFKDNIDAVTGFDIKRGVSSVLSFERMATGEWKVGGSVASVRRVSRFLTALATTMAVDFKWPVGGSNETTHASASLLAGYGLDAESSVTVTVKADGVGDQQVSFGKDAGDGLVFAYIQDGGAIVTVPQALKDAANQDTVMFTDSRLFPLEAKSVGYLSLVAGNVVCSLSRGEKGSWMLESPVSAPADSAAVDEVLSRILALTPYDVGAKGLSVSVSTSAVPVVVSPTSVLGNRRLEDLRSLEMLNVAPDSVRRIVRTERGDKKGSTAVVYSRERRTWNVEKAEDGAVADAQGVAQVLSVVNPLKALRVERLSVPAAELDDYELDKPNLKIAVDQERGDSVRKNIIVGGKTKDGWYATIGSSDAIFVISDEIVKALSVAVVRR